MPINMGEQFRGLPMGDLIGGPLMAACDAQVRLANATAQFIQVVGFVPKDGATAGADGTIPAGQLDVRTVDFKFDRPVQGGTPVNGVMPTETVSLTVPLLAVIKIPALAIDTVDITFDMEVKNSESEKSSEDKTGKFSADASVNYGIFSLKVHVEGSVATHKENTRSSDQSAKYHVEVHAADKGMPEGLARVLDIMNSAIAPKSVVAASPAPAPDNVEHDLVENGPQAAHGLVDGRSTAATAGHATTGDRRTHTLVTQPDGKLVEV